MNTAFQMFSVTINVTEKGMKDVERVSSIVFDYIRLLKSSEPLKWIFDEVHACCSMKQFSLFLLKSLPLFGLVLLQTYPAAADQGFRLQRLVGWISSTRNCTSRWTK